MAGYGTTKPVKSKRTGYSSYMDYWLKTHTPSPKRRIIMPQIPRRPLRFQLRTLIRKDVAYGKQVSWMTVHRRGVRRARIGENALEARAMQGIPGYLTERILYAALVNLFHFVPGVDFLFQSSLEGGRLEMGGLVADFLFPILRIVINPLGPQHYQFRNMAKDEEQIATLAEMGYQAFLIDEEVIYNELALEDFLRRIFGGMSSGGSDRGGFPAQQTSALEADALDQDDLFAAIKDLEMTLYGFFS